MKTGSEASYGRRGGADRTAVGQTVSLVSVSKSPFRTVDKLGSMLRVNGADIESGRFRILLYRFLTRNIPVINACIWTWVRLSAAPGKFVVDAHGLGTSEDKARERLNRLNDRLYIDALGNRTGAVTLLPDLFVSLYRDGLFGGFLTVLKDGSGIDGFLPIDPARIIRSDDEKPHLQLDIDGRKMDLDRPDFYYLPFNNSASDPFGKSILQSVPFVSYVEQQLVDDMRRSSHNSGYHRLHVKITPPERMTGESDSAYTDRINRYFDDTIDMIRSCDIDDNPVTWNNVAIEYIGPSRSREVANSWFLTHRAMIEDICAGTNLSPYLLGYSYGATTTWSAFKFDVVMRQVRSVQAEVARFMEWMGNIELALAGLNATCRYRFDNTFAYQAMDQSAIEAGRIDNILKLYNAGLIDEKTAREKAGELL